MLAIGAFCKTAKIEHRLLLVEREGKTRELCPCKECRDLLLDIVEHFERLDGAKKG
jgi:hypothetical protein